MNGKSILIVEDEAIIAAYTRRILENLGYHVTGLASTGEDALRKIQSSKPDLVLMDVYLAGDLNGIETAEIIRTSTRIPVLFMTAFADSETFRKALETRPLDYIVKPVTPELLLSKIQNVLSRSQQN